MFKYGSRCLFTTACLTTLAFILETRAQQSEGFFNGSSYARLYSSISLQGHTGLSFRTCVGGELFSQTNGQNSVSLEVRNEGLIFTVVVNGQKFDTRLTVRFLDNIWHSVNLLYRLGNLTLSVQGHSQIVANSSYNSEILRYPNVKNGNSVLIVGRDFHGCLLEGPGLVFNVSTVQAHNVEWGQCPLTINSCTKADHCYNEPCMRHGECINLPDRYECVCAARYSGNNCEINNGSPCEGKEGNPCQNGGLCEEDNIGNYKCICEAGFTGNHCEAVISSHLCESNPCMNNGSCRVSGNRYECTCMPGFAGPDCEVNVNECQPNPCRHGGSCKDGINNFTCFCGRTGYKGPICEQNINECENNPCLNQGTCFDTYGSYVCQCLKEFGGQNCELNLKECSSNPCRNGYCTDVVGSYECHCYDGFAGVNCEINIDECENAACPPNSECIDGIGAYQCVCKNGYPGIPPNCTEVDLCHSLPCLNGGTCFPSVDHYNCSCPAGFTGVHCERAAAPDWCISTPCRNGGTCSVDGCECPPRFTGHLCEVHVQCNANPCQHSSKCQDFSGGGYFCECEPGWTGPNCEYVINECQTNPCRNAGACVDTINGFYCECMPGFTGKTCQVNIDECISSPCQNGGICIDHVHGYKCNCTDDFMGDNCELNYDVCALMPCKNNGSCISHNKRDYACRCLPGFEGDDCEVNIDDCAQTVCPDNRVCVDGVNTYVCECRFGFQGENCSTSVDLCTESPCENNATCLNELGNYSCICPPGYEGRNCKNDIDECQKIEKLCNEGICLNTPGSYQCFCRPGYAGNNCELDIDECLSQPCKNNATCENRINSFLCRCTAGFSGKDCSVNIDECLSSPCLNGGTCVDGIAAFKCLCPPGFTGKLCESDIDDCQPYPCLNGGICIDGVNNYTCNCSDTGYEGSRCEINIDDCQSSPCTNGAVCHDGIKDYNCSCYEGYTGKNCEMDVNECSSSPCQYNGTCLERSNPLLYYPSGTTFAEEFQYSIASGYKCECVKGIAGENCETNLNECDAEPCKYGSCRDDIGFYVCECEDGYEGVNCESNINECERYDPCVNGTCTDLVADYNCDCHPNYGGKNCSVELTGCIEGACLNNGTCTPYLENETNQKFNCSCPSGFHGRTCEKVTTMSLNGSSQILVNTTREEGYDIQFRFKTTLPSGLLAIGKGATYYILELANGKLNLHSSLLNKWEGVFIGSNLTNSEWQRVFVAINTSHLVLAANDEQTIYPINPINEAVNYSSQSSFPTTYLGETPNYLTGLTHGPGSFTGCMEDVVINGQWVLPDQNKEPSVLLEGPPVALMGVGVGCPREDQCHPNPCQNGGACTDLWRNFSCACGRPYLGHTCQYNLTAATFGHENISDSLVKVLVSEEARRAIRNIVDISMFIRTRQEEGIVFLLGSENGGADTFIMAELEGGELLVKLQFNGTLEKYAVSGGRLTDGQNYLIQVVRNFTLVQVKINGTEYFRKTISATGQLNVDVLYLGGLPKQLRFARQTEGNPARSTDISEVPVNFKGIIQDVQITNGYAKMFVEFFPLNVEDLEIPPPFGQVLFDRSLVLEGVVSDDSCRDSPCKHNGSCYVTWNDFRCECTRGYKGKMCEEMEFCQLQQCPPGGTCRNLDKGYECVANATFDGHNMTLSYALDLTNMSSTSFPLDSINITYRSQSGGTLMCVSSRTSEEYFVVSVHRDEAIVSWRFADMDTGANHRLHKERPDGNWTTIIIKMENNGITGRFGFASEESPQSFTAVDFPLDAWQNLIARGRIMLGGIPDNIGFGEEVSVSNRHSYVIFGDVAGSENAFGQDGGGFFKGCLGEVRIGGLLLPFFTADQLSSENATMQNAFRLSSSSEGHVDLDGGCRLCFENECLNGGWCEAPAESYICNCSAGFADDRCSTNIDECKYNLCRNNASCTDGIANYTCNCERGWEGWLCDMDVDECASNPCQHDGTCNNLLGRFECNCTDEYMGVFCESIKLITCDNGPCMNGSTCTDVKNPETGDNFTCTCMEGFEGPNCNKPYCHVQPCQNGGTCNILGVNIPTCRCALGYEGKYCEREIDECEIDSDKGSPCRHGGVCTDKVGGYDCNCSSTGYEGVDCTVDIDECAFGDLPCGTGRCINIPGSFKCQCPDGKCGPLCAQDDPCYPETPCRNDGQCIEHCEMVPVDYKCECPAPYAGKNCTEMLVEKASSSAMDIAIIVAPIVGFIVLIAVVALSVFVTMARKKRATRGTYSPSQQEYCNPRVEMDNVMKPPPEERLI
ncbi:hypothetical protein C0J52_00824 [Blattella germanica]|nr:hypothetical protein C0J52_00824 [Blattella germanica]